MLCLRSSIFQNKEKGRVNLYSQFAEQESLYTEKFMTYIFMFLIQYLIIQIVNVSMIIFYLKMIFQGFNK